MSSGIQGWSMVSNHMDGIAVERALFTGKRRRHPARHVSTVWSATAFLVSTRPGLSAHEEAFFRGISCSYAMQGGLLTDEPRISVRGRSRRSLWRKLAISLEPGVLHRMRRRSFVADFTQH